MTDQNNQSTPNSLEQAAQSALTEAGIGAEESTESSEGQVIDSESSEGSEESSERSVSSDFEDGIASAKGESKDSKTEKKDNKDVKKAIDKVGAKKEGDKYTIKVDGESLELSKEEVIRYAQLGKAGQKKMQEAAELRQRVNTFIDMLKKDPASVLSDPAIGIDPIRFAQEILSKQLEEESKSPEQKEQEKLRSELESLRKEKSENEEKSKKDSQEQRMKQYETEISDKIIQIMEKGGLPNTPRYLRTVADIMLTAVENDLNISPEVAAKIAREEVLSDNKTLFESMSDEELEGFLGNDLIKRIRKNSIKKAQAPLAPQTRPQSTGTSTPKVEDAPKKISLKDFQKLW